MPADAKTLVWYQGELYDVRAGWRPYPPDGQARPRREPYGDRYDAAVISPLGDIVALTESTGTAGLLVSTEDGTPIREISRRRMNTAARYPIALCTLPDGRTGLVHCPDDFSRLEIEVAATGERLTGGDRDPEYFVQSRLAVSAKGRYLLSAGGDHDWQRIAVYDLHRALDDPTELDHNGSVLQTYGNATAEIAGACFVGDDVVVSTTDEQNEPEGPEDLGPNMLARWSTAQRRYLWARQHNTSPGDLVAFGEDVLALNPHPAVYRGSDGELIVMLLSLSTGRANGAFAAHAPFTGPARVAVDAAQARFAVTDGERLTIFGFGER